MATDAEKKATRRDSVASNINNPGEVAEVVRAFTSAVKSLSSDPGFQVLAELVDRIPKLEAEVQEKQRMAILANETRERENTSHDDLLRKSLSMYKEDIAKVQEQKNSLEQINTGLRTKITQNSDVIAKLENKQAELKENGRKMEEKCRSVIGKLKTKEGEIAQCQQQNQDSQTKIGKLTAELKVVQAEVTARENSLRDQAARQAQLANALKASRTQQEEVASYAVRLKDVDHSDLSQDFGAIWVAVTALVKRFIEEDLMDNALKRNWGLLNKAAAYITDKPLPQSNSAIAKELRVVKVLAILADTIHKHILQPTSQLPYESVSVSQALYHLATVEPKQERMLRGMLLGALAGQRERIENKVIDHIVEDVMKTQGIEDVIRLEHRDGFEEELKDILIDIQDIWFRVQHGTQVFQATFTYTPGVQITDFIPQSAEPQQDDAAPARAHDDANDIVMLFPVVMLLGEESVPITTATVVRKSRIAALWQEERRQSRNVEPQPPRSRQKQRTKSISSSARNGHAKEDFLDR